MSFDKTNYLENDTAVEADFTATPTLTDYTLQLNGGRLDG